MVSDRPDEQDLYFLKQLPGIPDWASGIASLNYESIAAHRHKFQNFDAALGKVRVKVLQIDELLQKYQL